MVDRKTNPRVHLTQVQKRFEAELYHRLVRDTNARAFRRHDPLLPEVREAIVDDDWLQLSDPDEDSGSGLFTDGGRRQSKGHDGEVTAQNGPGYDFPTDPGQLAAEFEEWLADRIDSGVLVRYDRTRVFSGQHWTAEHVRSASKKGVRHSRRELQRAGIDADEFDEPISAVLRGPIHEDILQSSYLRTYDELEGMTDEMARNIRRTLADGLAEGVNPDVMGSRMADDIEGGLTRGRMIARTETSRAYSAHAEARYDEHGIQEVKLLTHNPCSECADVEAGNPYKTGELSGIVPLHPNCLCSVAPVV